MIRSIEICFCVCNLVFVQKICPILKLEGSIMISLCIEFEAVSLSLLTFVYLFFWSQRHDQVKLFFDPFFFFFGFNLCWTSAFNSRLVYEMVILTRDS